MQGKEEKNICISFTFTPTHIEAYYLSGAAGHIILKPANELVMEHKIWSLCNQKFVPTTFQTLDQRADQLRHPGPSRIKEVSHLQAAFGAILHDNIADVGFHGGADELDNVAVAHLADLNTRTRRTIII